MSSRPCRQPPSRNPLVDFQHGFEVRFERVRAGYRDLLVMALARRGFHRGLPGVRAGLVPSGAVPRPEFLPERRFGQILMHARARSARASRRAPTSSRTSRRRSAQIIPPDELASMVDNIGMPVSGINMIYNNTGTIGPQDGDIQIKLTEHQGRPRITSRAAPAAARALPRRQFRLPAGRHHQPDPEFRRALADRRAGARLRPQASFEHAKAAGAIRQVPGVADARIQQSAARRYSPSISIARGPNMSA